MAQGFFTQGAVILLPSVPSREAMEAALARRFFFQFQTAVNPSGSWIGGYDTWIVAIPNTRRGTVDVMLANQEWPDAMGDPKSDPLLFGAWSMGHMGPFTFPGNLGRATAFAELAQKRGLAEQARRHRACVVLKCTHLRGAAPSDPVIPPDYNAESELRFITEVAGAILTEFDGAVYFNPGGETLHDAGSFASVIANAVELATLPVPVWTNVRIFKLDHVAPGWLMMDTIGFGQFGSPIAVVPDHEVCWPSGRAIDTREVWQFLLNMGVYVVESGPVIKNGHTADGAGVRWQATLCKDSLAPPPRSTIRWVQDDEQHVPESIGAVRCTPAPPPPPRKWWKLWKQ